MLLVLVFGLEVVLKYVEGMIYRTVFAVEVILYTERLRAVLERGMNGFVELIRGSLYGQGHELC